MRTILYPERSTWRALCRRPASLNETLFAPTREVLHAVKEQGTRALFSFTEKFDRVSLTSLSISAEKIHELGATIAPELKKAIDTARANIEKFHREQRTAEIDIETQPGVRCMRKTVPIERVGLYIPAGSAPLFSTALMLGIPAQIAGCKEIVVCTAPRSDGTIAPSIAYVLASLGIDREVYTVGGAQAIALLAYGADEILPCAKICGPGNSYVTAAKQLVALEGTAIDLPAGPSEVLVICDSGANPEFVAADLLSQAEHGPDSQVVVLTTDEQHIRKVLAALDSQLETLPRAEVTRKAISNSLALAVKSLDDALEFSNLYAPEHLILAVKNPHDFVPKVRSAGSVFCGYNTPESAGDYASGTNHTLPTAGTGRAYSGVSVQSFQKQITFQEITPEGLRQLGPTVMTMAKAESLDAHARAVEVRMQTLNLY